VYFQSETYDPLWIDVDVTLIFGKEICVPNNSIWKQY
jgi:hypothetical protein